MVKKMSYISIVIMLIKLIMPVQAKAIAPIIVAGVAVEVGTIAFWAGAAASVGLGVAIGLEDEFFNDLVNWANETYNNASNAIKDSISASVQEIKNAYDTTRKYVIEWSSDVQQYLINAWNEYFGERISVDPISNEIVDGWSQFFQMSNGYVPDYFYNGGKYFVLIESRLGINSDIRYSFYSFQAPPYVATTKNWTSRIGYEFTNPEWTGTHNLHYVTWYCTNACQPKAMGWSTVQQYISYAPGFSTYESKSGDIYDYDRLIFANFDIYLENDIRQSDVIATPFPANYPGSISIPAPRWIDQDGGVVIEKPKIGVIPGTNAITGITYAPTLTIDDAISTPATPPTPGFPDIPDPGMPDLSIFTNKFPFSLPWDVYHIFSLLSVPAKTPDFRINTHFGTDIPVQFSHKMDYLDPYMPFFRTLIFIVVCGGFIYRTRSLLGAGK